MSLATISFKKWTASKLYIEIESEDSWKFENCTKNRFTKIKKMEQIGYTKKKNYKIAIDNTNIVQG